MQFVGMGSRLSVVLTMRTVVPQQSGLVMCELNSRPVAMVTHKETVCSSAKALMLTCSFSID